MHQLLCIHKLPPAAVATAAACGCPTQETGRERVCCTQLRFIVRRSGFGTSGVVAVVLGVVVLSLKHPIQQRHYEQIAPRNAPASCYTTPGHRPPIGVFSHFPRSLENLSKFDKCVKRQRENFRFNAIKYNNGYFSKCAKTLQQSTRHQLRTLISGQAGILM